MNCICATVLFLAALAEAREYIGENPSSRRTFTDWLDLLMYNRIQRLSWETLPSINKIINRVNYTLELNSGHVYGLGSFRVRSSRSPIPILHDDDYVYVQVPCLFKPMYSPTSNRGEIACFGKKCPTNPHIQTMYRVCVKNATATQCGEMYDNFEPVYVDLEFTVDSQTTQVNLIKLKMSEIKHVDYEVRALEGVDKAILDDADNEIVTILKQQALEMGKDELEEAIKREVQDMHIPFAQFFKAP